MKLALISKVLVKMKKRQQLQVQFLDFYFLHNKSSDLQLGSTDSSNLEKLRPARQTSDFVSHSAKDKEVHGFLTC